MECRRSAEAVHDGKAETAGFHGFGKQHVRTGGVRVAQQRKDAVGHGGFVVAEGFGAALAVGGDMGCSLGPWLSGLTTDLVIAHTPAETLTNLGLTAEQLGLRSGMLAGVFFTLLLIAGLLISKKLKTADERK